MKKKQGKSVDKKKSGIPLATEEWDFTPCPDEQLRHCFEYEFSRTAFMEAGDGDPGKKIWDLNLSEPVMNKFRELFADFFPETPWIRINPDERVRRLAVLKKHDPDHHFPAFERVTADVLKEGRKHNNAVFLPVINEEPQFLATFPIRVDLMASDEEIRKRFTDTLKSLREACNVPHLFEGKGAKNALRAALKALGAMRLRQSMEDSEVIAHTKRHGFGLYADKTGLSRAERLARKVLASWVPSSFDERIKLIERIDDSNEVRQLLVLLAAGRTRATQHQAVVMPGAVVTKLGKHTQLAFRHALRITSEAKSKQAAKKARTRSSKM